MYELICPLSFRDRRSICVSCSARRPLTNRLHHALASVLDKDKKDQSALHPNTCYLGSFETN